MLQRGYFEKYRSFNDRDPGLILTPPKILAVGLDAPEKIDNESKRSLMKNRLRLAWWWGMPLVRVKCLGNDKRRQSNPFHT
jgi:hypothetical protein